MQRKPISFLSAALTEEEASVVRKAIAATGRRAFRRKRCFYNSQLLTISDAHVGYVEGVAIEGRSVWHHAWNVIGGKVVDLTWKHEGTLPPAGRYLGLVFTAQDVREHWLSIGTGMVQIPMVDDDTVRELTRRLESEVQDGS
jgi:hypothetical protein